MRPFSSALLPNHPIRAFPVGRKDRVHASTSPVAYPAGAGDPDTNSPGGMQCAETVGVLCERGRHGPPLERLYRQLFSPQLYLRAFLPVLEDPAVRAAWVEPQP